MSCGIPSRATHAHSSSETIGQDRRSLSAQLCGPEPSRLQDLEEECRLSKWALDMRERPGRGWLAGAEGAEEEQAGASPAFGFLTLTLPLLPSGTAYGFVPGTSGDCSLAPWGAGWSGITHTWICSGHLGAPEAGASPGQGGWHVRGWPRRGDDPFWDPAAPFQSLLLLLPCPSWSSFPHWQPPPTRLSRVCFFCRPLFQHHPCILLLNRHLPTWAGGIKLLSAASLWSRSSRLLEKWACTQ